MMNINILVILNNNMYKYNKLVMMMEIFSLSNIESVSAPSASNNYMLDCWLYLSNNITYSRSVITVTI